MDAKNEVKPRTAGAVRGVKQKRLTIKRRTAGKVIRMGGQDYVDIAGIASRIGVKPNSVQVYHTRAKRNRKAGDPKAWDLPEPDATFGRTPVWLVTTIEAWEAVRPGTNTEAATAARRKGSE